MTKKNALLISGLMTIFLSIPLLIKIPMSMQFLDSDVRVAAPKAIEDIRSQGLWLVNADLINIRKESEDVCFDWSYTYRSREKTWDPIEISTCIQ